MFKALEQPHLITSITLRGGTPVKRRRKPTNIPSSTLVSAGYSASGAIWVLKVCAAPIWRCTNADNWTIEGGGELGQNVIFFCNWKISFQADLEAIKKKNKNDRFIWLEGKAVAVAYTTCIWKTWIYQRMQLASIFRDRLEWQLIQSPVIICNMSYIKWNPGFSQRSQYIICHYLLC